MRSKAQHQADRDARFIKLWNQGIAAEVISARLGLSRKGIGDARVRLGLEPRTSKANWS